MQQVKLLPHKPLVGSSNLPAATSEINDLGGTGSVL
jgi:hypothetical protein